MKLVNRAAVMIHAAIHKARADVVCAMHTHYIYGRTFSGLRLDLPITSQDACAFYEDVALYDRFDGIVLDLLLCLAQREDAVFGNVVTVAVS